MSRHAAVRGGGGRDVDHEGSLAATMADEQMGGVA